MSFEMYIYGCVVFFPIYFFDKADLKNTEKDKTIQAEAGT